MVRGEKYMIYLDNAATTEPYDEVVEVVAEKMKDFYNPSSLYAEGVERYRKRIEDLLGVKEGHIYFTSGGTESNNWVMNSVKGHVVTDSIEHHSVLRSVSSEGGLRSVENSSVVEVDRLGMVNVEDIVDAIRDDTVLVSVMLVNNVVGTIQKVKEIVQAVKAVRSDILVHTDAVQAVGKIKVDVEDLGVDFLSASAHKFHGPKGVGFLYCRKDIGSMIKGGGQERGKRAGTENVPGIAGMCKALEISMGKHVSLEEVHKKLIQEVSCFEGHKLVGGMNRIAGNVYWAFKDVSGEALVMELWDRGYACSVGSACDNGSLEGNYVLKAMGYGDEWNEGGLRITFDEEFEIEGFIEALKDSLMKLRGYV